MTRKKKKGRPYGFAALLALCGCVTPGEPTSPELSFLRGVGDAIVRIDGTEALRRYAPQAIPLLDTGGGKDEAGNDVPDGVVSLDEVLAMVSASSNEELAVRTMYLVIMVREIIAKRNG